MQCFCVCVCIRVCVYIYVCVCVAVQQFKVSVNPTKASEANKLQGYYMLSPTRDSLRLLDMISFKSIHEWPYRQIRKYGRTRNVFRMEVGRRCSTGEGEFEFFTPEGSTLTELITMYTRQVQEQDTRNSQEGSLSPLVQAEHASRDHADRLTPSPPDSPSGLIHRRASENMKDTRDSDPSSQRMRQRSSASSVSSGTRPVPAPRMNFVAAPNQENGSIRPTGKSSDMKIYETPSGLTAPLNSKLKRELQSKLHVQTPDSEVVAPSGHPAEASEDPPCSTPEPVADRHSSGGVFKDKKKSDKDKKKREKEEAKLRKQQEKEQKEREAKEQKEREKRLKKESKGHSKLQGKRSLDVQCPIPATVSASDGNVYDEPGELVPVSTAAQPVADESAYTEAGAVAKPQLNLYAEATVPHKPTIHQTRVEDDYATPEKPKKDSWKKHARDESEDIQQENYESIKMACLARSKSQPPPLPPQPQFCNPTPGADDVDDVYDRLRNFDRRTAAAHAPENVYGMASAVETMRPQHPTPVPVVSGGNEYEEADTLSDVTRQAHTVQEVGSEYEDTAPLTPQHRPDPVNVNIPNDGDYADIS